MRNHAALVGMLLYSLLQDPSVAGTIYRWSDRQGQVHFSDTAPNDPQATLRIQQTGPIRSTGGNGLRAGELETLRKIQQRSQQQAQRAQARRLQQHRKHAEQQERCQTNRENLHDARGKETYKQYSSYLRKYCW